MKKISVLLLFATIMFIAASCEKEGATITKTVNVEINSNAAYSYTVPHAGDADDAMQITQQAMHSSVSKITPDASTGDALFEYVPATNFSGTDEVQVSNVEEHHNGNHGNCGGHRHDDTYIYVFKITVKNTL